MNPDTSIGEYNRIYFCAKKAAPHILVIRAKEARATTPRWGLNQYRGRTRKGTAEEGHQQRAAQLDATQERPARAPQPIISRMPLFNSSSDNDLCTLGGTSPSFGKVGSEAKSLGCSAEMEDPRCGGGGVSVAACPRTDTASDADDGGSATSAPPLGPRASQQARRQPRTSAGCTKVYGKAKNLEAADGWSCRPATPHEEWVASFTVYESSSPTATTGAGRTPSRPSTSGTALG